MKVYITLFICTLFSLYSYAQQVNPDQFKQRGISTPLQVKQVSNSSLNDYDVSYYKLDLNVSDASTYISGNTEIIAKATSAVLDTIVLELDNPMNVDSVLLDSVSVGFLHQNNLLYVYSPVGIAQDNYFSVVVYYAGTPSGAGVTNDAYIPFIYPDVTWTLSESYHAKEWFPCKQDLNDKADSASIILTVPQNQLAGSNGKLRSVTTVNGTEKRFEWFTGHPIVYYLISFAVSEYSEYNSYAYPAGTSDSIFIQNYVYNTNPNTLGEIATTAGLIELFSDLFGMYPYADEKYGHAMAPIGGGMEHQTMTTCGWFEMWLIAHELGHQWFGDYVTCSSWQDIWINEGFASYCEYIAWENVPDQAQADNWIADAHTYALTEPNGSVYIPITDVYDEMRIFSYELSYKKGASLLHMIRFILNDDDLFIQILKDYLIAFGGSTASGADFRDFLTTASGIDFTDFFDQWYYGQGFPTFDVTWWQDGDSLKIIADQTGSSASTPLFKTPIEYKIRFSDLSDTIVRVFHGNLTENYSIYLTKNVSAIEVDPNNWLLNQEGSIIVGTIESELNANYFCYPNPVMDILNIRTETVQEFTLSDISGKVVMKIQTSTGQNNIDVSGLNSGLYWLRNNTDGRSTSKKIVKL